MIIQEHDLLSNIERLHVIVKLIIFLVIHFYDLYHDPHIDDINLVNTNNYSLIDIVEESDTLLKNLAF